MVGFNIPARSAVVFRDFDLTERIRAATSSSGAIVLQAAKGPVVPTIVTNRDDFTEKYGIADPVYGNGVDCGIDFLTQSDELLVYRIHNGAKWAGYTYHNDLDENATETFGFGFKTGGASGGYDSGAPRQLQVLLFTADLVTDDSIDIDVTNGIIDTPASMTTVTYATSHAATLANFAAQLQTTINGISGVSGAIVEVLGDRSVRVISPENVELTFSDFAVTSGVAGTAETEIHSDVKLFDVFADNPGKWAKDKVGIKVVDIDQGTKQRSMLTFSAALVTSNTFNCSVNGTAISEVTFATDSDTTMAAIATAIKAVIDANVAQGSTVEVIEVPGGVSNDRQIEIVAPTAEIDITITGAVVAAGASQATVTFEETLTKIAPDGTYTLEVYTSDNINTPIESFIVSNNRQQDGFGTQQNVAEVVNNSPSKSKLIKIYQPEDAIGLPMLTEDTSIRWLANGDDGAAINASHIVAGWTELQNRNKYDFRIAINGGYTMLAVHQKMVAVCETRRDCFACLDMPSDRQDREEAVNYRNNVLNVNSSYGAIYTPDVEIIDEYTDRRRYVPLSGRAAAQMALTDRTRAVYYSPHGPNRGILRQVVGLRYEYDEGDQNLLARSQINPAILHRGIGPHISESLTLQKKLSILSNIHARRLLIQIEIAGTEYATYFLQEPTREFTRFQIVQGLNAFLTPIQVGGGLHEFLVVSDEDTNPDYLVNEGIINVDMYLTITPNTRTILLNAILTKVGASYQELQTSGGSLALA